MSDDKIKKDYEDFLFHNICCYLCENFEGIFCPIKDARTWNKYKDFCSFFKNKETGETIGDRIQKYQEGMQKRCGGADPEYCKNMCDKYDLCRS